MDAFTWIVIGFLYLTLFVIFPPTSFITSAQLYLAVVSTSFGDFLLSEPSGIWDFYWEIPNLFQITFGRNPIQSEFKNALWSRSYFSSLSGLAKFPLSSLPFFYGCWHSNEFSLNQSFSLVILVQFSSFFFLV